MDWFDSSVFYHIYPLGYCGCKHKNDFDGNFIKGNILKIKKHIPILKEQGFNAVYFGPVFESSEHGYDTADYLKIDSRLGTNDDFKELSDELHENGFKVVIDGVFNHVGRDFWAFKDVCEHKFASKYKDWFHIHDGNSPYNDGFHYEGWEGHYNLVKLNLYNPEVKNYLKDAVSAWVREFQIDGLRLDVAYCLDLNFLKELRTHCNALKSDFWLMGETLHGDYNKWMNSEMLDSVTNYECYKGIYSSFNDLNMFEIAHSINRQFGSENWCLYRGKNLYTFADNHDVIRIATMLKDKKHLEPLYTLLFTMPGIPSVYYGSEYTFEGDKSNLDYNLRPEFILDDVKNTELTEHISKLAKLRGASKALAKGNYKQEFLQNRAYAFSRTYENEKVYCLINADDKEVTINLPTMNAKENIFVLKAYGSEVVVVND